jgi:hypothetical protein
MNFLNFYLNIPEALTPLSAGTETVVCYTCLSDLNNGIAFYYTNKIPHPTWTNGYGKEIVELDMVLIGSGNGLNS